MFARLESILLLSCPAGSIFFTFISRVGAFVTISTSVTTVRVGARGSESGGDSSMNFTPIQPITVATSCSLNCWT